MSLRDYTPMKAATGHTITGGTAALHGPDAVQVNNGVHVYDTTEPNFVDRCHATFKARNPSLRSDGTHTKGWRGFNYTIPFTNAAGVIEYATFRGEMDIPAEMLEADILELRLKAGQQILSADTDDYFNAGSIL
jgi:hypothetical protein